MKETLLKLSAALKKFFGYGILTTLFLGGFTFFAYVIAVIVGGETAVWICDVVNNKMIPVLIYVTNICVALGLVAMYLAGETALTTKKK